MIRPNYPGYPQPQQQQQQPQQQQQQPYGQTQPQGGFGGPPPPGGYGAPPLPGAYGTAPPPATYAGGQQPQQQQQQAPPQSYGGPPPPGGWNQPPPQQQPVQQPPPVQQQQPARPPMMPGMSTGGVPQQQQQQQPPMMPGMSTGGVPQQQQQQPPMMPGMSTGGVPQQQQHQPPMMPGMSTGGVPQQQQQQPPMMPGMSTGGVPQQQQQQPPMMPGMSTGGVPQQQQQQQPPMMPGMSTGGVPQQQQQQQPPMMPGMSTGGVPQQPMMPGMNTGGVPQGIRPGMTVPPPTTTGPPTTSLPPQPNTVIGPGGVANAPRPSYPGASGGPPPTTTSLPPGGGPPLPGGGPPLPNRSVAPGPLPPPVSGPGAPTPPVFINPQNIAPRSAHPSMAQSQVGAGGGASHIGQQMANMSMGEPARFSTVWDPAGMENAEEKFPLQSQEGQCRPNFMRLTVNAFPNTTALAQRFGFPLGIVIRPLHDVTPVPLVNFGAAGVIRCRRCRTYVNPFVAFLDAGRRWRCNVCGLINDLPAEYFCNLDANNRRRDIDERPELKEGTVEFVAPQDYMMRTPQPPVYVFLVDVSVRAVSSGMLRVATQTIKATLEELNLDPRTQVALMTFDNTFTFYNLRSNLAQPQALVVPDIENPFLPVPNDLLVYLSESKELFLALLDKLPTIFQDTDIHESCLGPALQAATMLMSNLGGKLLVFQTTLPSLGKGGLQPREDIKLLGTEKEALMLQPANDYYKSIAMDCSKNQICVDLFTFPQQYIDLASLSALTKFTGGQLFHYPAFDANRDGDVFSFDLRRVLSRPTGFEAVLRVRCTKGVKVSAFFGNFYLRGTDLLALPNVDCDKSFTGELSHEEQTLTSSHVFVQCALLYTTSSGERRIRVHNLNVPVVSEIRDLYAAVDPDTMACVMAKQSIDFGISNKLADARARLQDRFVQGLRSYRAMMQVIALPKQLDTLPLMILAALKNAVLRDGVDVRTDERIYLACAVGSFSVQQTRALLVPSLFAIHTLAASNYGGVQAGKVIMPPLHALSLEQLASDGMYLVENGMVMMLWIGKNCAPQLVQSLLNVPNADRLDSCKYEIPQLDNDINQRLRNVVASIREARTSKMPLYIVRQGGASEGRFLSLLVEDRTVATMSYSEFWSSLARTLG